MSVWRLIIHTNEVNKYCLEHNVAAMGWSFNDLSPRYSELKAKADSLSDNWEDFVDCAEAMEYDFDSVIKLHNEVTAGDFIWTCLNESYYLARVEHQSKWRFCQDARTIEAANQLTNIQWHYVGNKNNLVPPTLEAAFTDERTFRRINDYDVEAFSAWLMRAFEAKTFIEPANIWRILLNPAFGDISQYCLDNNVAAMGWSFSELSDDSDLALSVKKIKTLHGLQ